MPIISQGISVPPGLADGQVALASQITPLYAALNALNIPGTIGVWQQGLVDDNRYASTGGSQVDWAFATPFNKTVMFVLPFSWTGSTNAPTFTLRANAAAATTSTGLTFTNTSSADGMLAGFIGPRSTDTVRSGFALGMDSATAASLKASSLSVALTTGDLTSLGVQTSSAGSGITVVWHSVRFWQEG